MIRELFAIIGKNLKRLTRSKLSTFMIVFGPLLLMMLAGIAFDQTQLYGIRIGVHLDKSDDLTTKLIDTIQKQKFKVAEYTSVDSCVESVRNGASHLCMALKQQQAQYHVTFHVDFSRVNLVYTLVSTLNSGLGAQADQLTFGMADEIFSTLGEATKTLQTNTQAITDLSTKVSSLQTRIANASRILQSVQAPTIGADTSGAKKDLSSSISDITAISSDIDSRLKAYESDLNEVEAIVNDVDSELATWNAEVSSIRKTITDVYNRRSCSTQENLFTSTNSQQIADRLSEDSDPTCSLLYSTKTMLDERAAFISSTSADVSNLKKQVSSAKSELQSAQSATSSVSSTAKGRVAELSAGLSQFEKQLSDAQTKAAELNSFKTSFATELSLAQATLGSGLSDLAKFNDSITQMSAKLGQLGGLTPEGFVNPIRTEVKPLLTDKKLLDYLFPSLILFVVTFTSIMLSSTLVMKEKLSRAYFRNFLTPVSEILFLLGSFLTSVCIVLVQVVVLLLLGQFVFGVSAFDSWYISIVTALFVSVFVLIGMCIGYLFKSEETTTLVAISICCVLVLFSSLIVPIENVRSSLAMFLEFSPFVLSDIALRQVLLFGLIDAWSVFLLSSYIVVLGVLVFYAQRVSKKLFE